MNGRAFEGSFPGTAEQYLLSHLHLREKVVIGALLLLALCGCAHDPLPLTHDAAGCMAACPGAQAVQASETGAMCRCWSANAFAYTFAYPESEEKLTYARSRWQNGLRNVANCQRQGLGWETNGAKDTIQCVAPEPPDPNTHALRFFRTGDWPRFYPKPAWMLWRIYERSA